MNEELATYITRLCELSGHTTRIKNDLVKVEPGEDFVYDAFTMVEEYYAYGHVERYSFGGAEFSSASFEIFKKFAIMHFSADIRAAHPLPPRTVPAVTDKQSLAHSQNIHKPLASCAAPAVISDEHTKRGPAQPRPRTLRCRIRRAVPARLRLPCSRR